MRTLTLALAVACLLHASFAFAEELPMPEAAAIEAPKADAAEPAPEKIDRVALCKMEAQSASDRVLIKYEAEEMAGRISHDEADEIRSEQFHKTSRAIFDCNRLESK